MARFVMDCSNGKLYDVELDCPVCETGSVHVSVVVSAIEFERRDGTSDWKNVGEIVGVSDCDGVGDEDSFSLSMLDTDQRAKFEARVILEAVEQANEDHMSGVA